MLERQNKQTTPEFSHRPWNKKLNKTAGGLLLAASSLAASSLAGVGLGHDGVSDRAPGPYVASAKDFTVDEGDDSAYADKKAEVLQLGDTFGGIITAEGMSLTVDTKKIEKTLSPHEVVTVSQIGMGEDGQKEMQTTVIKSPNFIEYVDSDGDQYMNQLKMSFSTTASKSIGDQPLSVKNGQRQNFGFGVSIKTLESPKMNLKDGSDLSSHLLDKTVIRKKLSNPMVDSIVQLSKYRFEKDGGITLLDRKESDVTLINNVFCGEGIPEKITSETELTPEQNQVVCTMLEKYGKFIPDTYRLLLDSVAADWKATDSQSNRDGKGKIILTYPYVGKNQVPATEVNNVALHESFHAAYGELSKDSQLFKNIQKAYDGIYQAMEYEMPEGAVEASSNVSIGQVEKVWGVITESTYVNEKNGNTESRAGHPWDNQTEMLSSVVTSLAYYPDQFLRHYAELNQSQQEVINQAINVTVGLVKHSGYQTTDIIPKYDEIQKQLGTIK